MTFFVLYRPLRFVFLSVFFVYSFVFSWFIVVLIFFFSSVFSFFNCLSLIFECVFSNMIDHNFWSNHLNGSHIFVFVSLLILFWVASFSLLCLSLIRSIFMSCKLRMAHKKDFTVIDLRLSWAFRICLLSLYLSPCLLDLNRRLNLKKVLDSKMQFISNTNKIQNKNNTYQQKCLTNWL